MTKTAFSTKLIEIEEKNSDDSDFTILTNLSQLVKNFINVLDRK